MINKNFNFQKLYTAENLDIKFYRKIKVKPDFRKLLNIVFN